MISTLRSLTKNFRILRKEASNCKHHTYVCSISSLRLQHLRNFSTSNFLQKLSDIKTPNFPESITEGDIRWIKSQGASVRIDDVIGEVETDKTSIPVISPYNGVLKQLMVPDGSKVTKGQILCQIDEDSQTQTQPQTRPSPPQVKEIKPVEVKPQPPPEKKQAETPTVTAETTLEAHSTNRVDTKVPMTRMRQTIAARLKEAQNTNAMLTTFNEIDMSAAIQMRNKYKDRVLKQHGIKLGFMSTFINASVYALKAQPTVNGVIINNEIIYRNYIDISVAVSSPKGLVVPVIRNAHLLNTVEMEKAVATLAEKAQKNQLAIEDMEGGTFTISNGGVFGSMLSTPIINIPQSSILGMHSIKDRAVVVDGKIEIRPIMYVALTYDHRLIDGREAVTFLKRIKDSIEDPSTIIMGF